MRGAGGTGEAIRYLCKCVGGVLRIVRSYRLVRPETPDCPLDPLIFVDTPTQYGNSYLTIVCQKSSKLPYSVGAGHISETSGHMVWEW